MIRCKVSFQCYTGGQLELFNQEILGNNFANINSLTKVSSKCVKGKHGIMDERDVIEYDFVLNGDAVIHIAVVEISTTIDSIHARLKNTNNVHPFSTVCLTLDSKDMCPVKFELVNDFKVKRLLFGNLFKNSTFNPVLALQSNTQPFEILKTFLKCQKAFDGDMGDDNIVTLFDHGRGFFSTFFSDCCCQSQRVVEIKTEYSSLRRITVTFGYQEKTDDNKTICITFHVAHPPQIFFHVQRQNSRGGIYFTNRRSTTWNTADANPLDIKYSTNISIQCKEDVDDQQFLNCIGRLFEATKIEIEFRALKFDNLFKYEQYQNDFLQPPYILPAEFEMLKGENYSPLIYALEALKCRGGEIYDYFFRHNDGCFESFLNFVITKYETDRAAINGNVMTKTVRALQIMLEKIGVLLEVPHPITFFRHCYDTQSDYDIACKMIQKQRAIGYTEIQKVVCTPSGTYLCNPEIIMSNRCTRLAGSENFIRVVFRDDNGCKLNGVQKTFAKYTVDKFLKEPKFFAMKMFGYLGSSDSQMNDNGCYFYTGNVHALKDTIGKLDFETVPKLMKSFGHNLAQSWESTIKLSEGEYVEVGDVRSIDGYIVTADVGLMTKNFANTIADVTGHPNFVPTCIQFSFRGYRGILVLDVSNKICQYSKAAKVMFRTSQRKFHGSSSYKNFEVLKLCTPCDVVTHTPMLNIYDQIFENQNTVSHTTFKKRIFQLIQSNINDVCLPLIDHDSSLLALNRCQKLVDPQHFGDFAITDEPFFHSALQTVSSSRLKDLVYKTKIKLPSNMGRVMFGVVDETGTLESGQVYICYSNDSSVKFPSKGSIKTTVIGNVSISKKFSYLASEVRTFKAVDVDALHGLVDVLVFSMKGARPDYDKICGASLSGDDYFTVIWDPAFIHRVNEQPIDYTETPSTMAKYDNLDSIYMANTFKDYICNDSVGSIANCFLANSDIYGVSSTKCLDIATKLVTANQFRTTGIAPESLTDTERVETFPNFMRKSFSPMYTSSRTLGDIHERLSCVNDAVKIKSDVHSETIMVDASLVVNGYNDYRVDAEQMYEKYSKLVQNICDSYGIKNDAQIFTNRFSASKYNERFEGEMIMFNTHHLVKEMFTDIYEDFRTQFFEQFGGIERHTQERFYHAEMRSVFSRTCTDPGIELRKKASAYYIVAYQDKKYLSFPWIVADILMFNRRHREGPSLPPLLQNEVTKYMKDSIAKMFPTQFNHFVKKMQRTYESGPLKFNGGTNVVAQVRQSFSGFDTLLFFIEKWASNYGFLGEFKNLGSFVIHLLNLDTVSQQNIDVGTCFLNFVKKLSNIESSRAIVIRYFNVTESTVLHDAAAQTFHYMAFNRIFDILSCNPIIETENFTIDLPIGITQKDIEQKLQNAATRIGCKHVAVKMKPEPYLNQKNRRYTVKAMGTLTNIWTFQKLLRPVIGVNDKNGNEDVASKVFKDLSNYEKDRI